MALLMLTVPSRPLEPKRIKGRGSKSSLLPLLAQSWDIRTAASHPRLGRHQHQPSWVSTGASDLGTVCDCVSQLLIISKAVWHARSINLYLPAYLHACAAALQSCLTLCDAMDCSPPGSSVRGILQIRTLEGVAMPSSRGASRPVALSLLRGQVGSSSLAAPGGPVYICVYLCACSSLALLLLFLPSVSLYDVHINTYMWICVHFYLLVLLLRTILTVTGTIFLWCQGMRNTESSSCRKPVLVNERRKACAHGSDRLVQSPLPWTPLGGELQRAGRGMTRKGVVRSGCAREQSRCLAPGSGGSLHLVQAQV